MKLERWVRDCWGGYFSLALLGLPGFTDRSFGVFVWKHGWLGYRSCTLIFIIESSGFALEILVPLLDRETGTHRRIGNTIEEHRRRNVNTASPTQTSEQFQVVRDLVSVFVVGQLPHCRYCGLPRIQFRQAQSINISWHDQPWRQHSPLPNLRDVCTYPNGFLWRSKNHSI